MELDHVFLRARAGGPEAQALRGAGLAEGSPNTHPGQGTANRRFFFGNAYIELLWIEDEAEVDSDLTRPTQLGERLRAGTASPFGICFRPSSGPATVPFPAWDYRPAYLPAGMAIQVGRDVPLAEPMWFYLAQARAPQAFAEHAAGLREITSVKVMVPGVSAWSAAARAAMEEGGIVLVEGEAHCLEIGFDGAASGRIHDFRPVLPLIFKLP
ncbi:VOC family protein [Massilia sp. YIM B02763]|uniref:VOC family protein n=1 Tax=Massilia sp. YIM B02763 TaxID=3050130 RepID=UPI0025B6957F|nr:VOC family protein [Massilia sp. YIM B02763]MDN4054600.1 VOC family protein [Massilia sp. YIM B02763]